MTNEDLQMKALLPVKSVVKMVYGDNLPSYPTIMSWINDGINGLKMPVVETGTGKYHRYCISVEAFTGWLDEVTWEASVIAKAPRKKAADVTKTDLQKQAEDAMKRIQRL